METSSSKPKPSQVTGGLTQLQGTVESTIGSITGAESWKDAGEEHQRAGTEEVEQAQKNARSEAREERIQGKFDSLKGMILGDEEKQTQGNIQTETAEWKKAVEGQHQLPDVSSERLAAKIKT
ncbi:hypothetical protein ABW19_dt0204955 [Dactylella cylindrospora]|nr:hypothetical protein ABW19_dt0204955 [Dactylella cylindrospora]